ncbi:YesK family protein [Bacillus xiapuensis]|uniref:YesK family protein n=1 Tax=Bacillus xiapuensis TaxID=2014075 RepID=UPI000C23DDC5|nr:YesK family protein [Bacillus xiapuensis]
MEFFSNFSLLTVGLILIIIIISFLLFKRKKILFPLIVLLIGLVLFFSSFTIGGWEGMGLGMFSLSLLVASFVSLALLMFYETYKTIKNTRSEK